MKETKIQIPADCEVDKIETQEGFIVVTYKQKERKLPKSWEQFREMFPVNPKEFYIDNFSRVLNRTDVEDKRDRWEDKNMLPDRATAEAVLVLCQLIQLRNCYNGDWVPDWNADKVETYNVMINVNAKHAISCGMLYFRTKELRDEFMRYFSHLIDKLRPLYGVKEGGEE